MYLRDSDTKAFCDTKACPPRPPSALGHNVHTIHGSPLVSHNSPPGHATPRHATPAQLRQPSRASPAPPAQPRQPRRASPVAQAQQHHASPAAPAQSYQPNQKT